jgi:hypothetical protein
MELQNNKDWPKKKTAKFIVQGLVSYKDSGAGIALLKNKTINDALDTFIGKPLLLEHAEVTPDNYSEHRRGNVIGTSYSPEDGWYSVDFLVDDDEAIRCIEQEGYSVSCAYNVLDVADGGTYQDIEYDGEITKISFTHLALVKVPRYEESRILDEMPAMMLNGKIQAKTITKREVTEMLSIFKKKQDGTKEEITPMVLINGKEIPLNELLEAVKLENAKTEKYMAKDEDIVDVNGNTISIGQLKSAYNKMLNEKESEKKDEEKKDNAKDEQEKDVEGEKDKKDKPEDEEEKAKKEAAKKNEKEEEKKEEKKENSKETGDKFFAEMQNAASKADEFKIEHDNPVGGLTRMERAVKWADKSKKK